MAEEAVVDALRALRSRDLDRALASSRRATGSLLGRALSEYLGQRPDLSGSVYTDPAAFQAFITGGGNVGLYEATSARLARIHDRFAEPAILDIGCGDGAALVPALSRAASRPRRLDLVEPSAALLDTAVRRLAAMRIEATPHPGPVQEYVDRIGAAQRWDVAESTFALHTLPVRERSDVLRALRRHVDRLAIVEFDVPPSTPGSDEHLEFLATTYEQGLAEYGERRALVAQGFLLPVLVGQLAPGAARMTYEQPAAEWAALLRDCGYTRVALSPLYPYWSSPAFLLTARGEGAAG